MLLNIFVVRDEAVDCVLHHSALAPVNTGWGQ